MKIDDHNYQISLAVPKQVIRSIDKFIENGDGWDIVPSDNYQATYPKSPLVDISRSALIKFLITAYGDKYTDTADYVNADILAQKLPNGYYTFRTKNPIIVHRSTKELRYALVTAMVYMGIPIDGFFDGKQSTNLQSY